MNAGAEAYRLCAATGRVLLWMRDPIQRFLSAWHAISSTHPGDCKLRAKFARFIYSRSLLNSRNADGNEIDIDAILREIAIRNSGRLGGEDWSELALLVPHSDMGAEHYLHTTDATALPVAFVGRTERMKGDWAQFLHTTLKLSSQQVQYYMKQLPHSHNTPGLSTRKLSSETVSLLRAYFAKDYAIIHSLVRTGLLQREFEERSLSNEATYAHRPFLFPIGEYYRETCERDAANA